MSAPNLSNALKRSGWEVKTSKNGRQYYGHNKTKKSRWTRPTNVPSESNVQPPLSENLIKNGWILKWSLSKQGYYYQNKETRDSTFYTPPDISDFLTRIGWTVRWDEQNKQFYYENKVTGQTQLDIPIPPPTTPLTAAANNAVAPPTTPLMSPLAGTVAAAEANANEMNNFTRIAEDADTDNNKMNDFTRIGEDAEAVLQTVRNRIKLINSPTAVERRLLNATAAIPYKIKSTEAAKEALVAAENNAPAYRAAAETNLQHGIEEADKKYNNDIEEADRRRKEAIERAQKNHAERLTTYKQRFERSKKTVLDGETAKKNILLSENTLATNIESAEKTYTKSEERADTLRKNTKVTLETRYEKTLKSIDKALADAHTRVRIASEAEHAAKLEEEEARRERDKEKAEREEREAIDRNNSYHHLRTIFNRRRPTRKATVSKVSVPSVSVPAATKKQTVAARLYKGLKSIFTRKSAARNGMARNKTALNSTAASILADASVPSGTNAQTIKRRLEAEDPKVRKSLINLGQTNSIATYKLVKAAGTAQISKNYIEGKNNIENRDLARKTAILTSNTSDENTENILAQLKYHDQQVERDKSLLVTKYRTQVAELETFARTAAAEAYLKAIKNQLTVFGRNGDKN